MKAPRWAWAVATGFGSGRLRPAPGTWGSLAAVGAWCGLTLLLVTPQRELALHHPRAAWMPYLPILGELIFLSLPLLMTWIAVRTSTAVVRETGDKDPGYIVADEWAGQWIALWPLRWTLASDLPFLLRGGWQALPMVLLPFLLFRLFDIWKPWPCRQIQDLPEGEGIVADDVVAGLYALPLVGLLHPLAMRCLR